jgi:cobalt/nickel transport system permease protein
VSGTHHFLTDHSIGTSPVHRLDPRVKIVGFLALTIVGVSTPATALWAFALYFAILFFLVGLSRLPVRFVLRRAAVVLPVVALVALFLPFFHAGDGPTIQLFWGITVSEAGLIMMLNVLLKALLGAMSAIVLGLTTSFSELIAGLDGLHAPRVFTLIVTFMYRYSFVFVEEARRMHRAMVSRNYRGRWLWDAKIVGHVISSLFLRSYSRGERVYVAMLSRGYDGTMPAAALPGIHSTDAAFVAALGLTLAVIRVGVAW